MKNGFSLCSKFITLNFPLLLHKPINSPRQLLNGLMIPALHCVHQTVLNVILQNYLSRIINSRLHRRELHKNLTAVPPILYHALYGFHMSDSPGKTIQNCFCILVGMSMSMGMTVSMIMTVLMGVIILM